MRTWTALLVVAVLGCGAPAAPAPAAVDTAPVDAPVADTSDTSGADAPAETQGADTADAADPPWDPTPGTACPVVDFAPCGGDLQGTWRFLRYCPGDLVAAGKVCEHPYDGDAACSKATNPAVCDWYPDQTLVFDEDKVTMTAGGSLKATWTFTDPCLQHVQPGSPQAACQSIANAKVSCSYGPPCVCKSAVPLPGEGQQNTGTWAKVGGTGLVILPGGGEQWPMQYCVQGKILVLDWENHPQSWRYWVLRKE